MDESTGLRERKRERTRKAIAEAALELFARQGFHDTTIPQIAEAADVSPRTVSGYFPAKEDLAFPYADAQMAEFERRLDERAAGETAADALRAWIPAMVEQGVEPPADIRRRREVIDADESLRARERHYMLRTQDVLTGAFATDLGARTWRRSSRAWPPPPRSRCSSCSAATSSPATRSGRSRRSTARSCSSAAGSARCAAQ